MGKGKKDYTVRTTKQKINATIGDIFTELNKQLPIYLRHVYNIWHQSSTFRTLKSKLEHNEIIIIVDFSENYVTKYHSEIQSVHFGASKKQITLHTGVFYHRHEEDKIKTTSFCSVSDYLEHGPSGIWAYLQPVLH